ncbi:hypothetical protein ASG67_15285 [Sphingomonas sp. Leaf339]|nr:hypothetical protein ASG67_15285 [Sphingomonas sp. Leaf339]
MTPAAAVWLATDPDEAADVGVDVGEGMAEVEPTFTTAMAEEGAGAASAPQPDDIATRVAKPIIW